MKNEKITMRRGINSIFFILFVLLPVVIYSQWLIPNDEHLEIELKKQSYGPFIEIRNVTSDTIVLFSKLKVEQEKIGIHILGYKKDSVGFTKGVLKSCYHCIEEYFYLGNSYKSRIKIPPNTNINTYFPYLYEGEYYFKIQTIYGYRGKGYLWSVETNKIKID